MTLQDLPIMTGETQWENPSPSKTKITAKRRKSSVKSDWQQFKDIDSGDFYYYNSKTGYNMQGTHWYEELTFL